MASGSTGYYFIILIVSLGIFGLIYGFYYPVYTGIFYNLALQAGMPVAKADMFFNFYVFSPLAAFLSMIVYFLINSMMPEGGF
jgi:hypothetical protein